MMMQVEQPCKSSYLLEEEKESLFSSLLDKNRKILASRNVSSTEDHLNKKSISEEEEEDDDDIKNTTVDQHKQNSDIDMGMGIDTVIDAPGVVENTTSNRKLGASNSSSIADTIKMNEVDEEGALDQLMYDLSNDEVSMVIDIFGTSCDVGSNKPQSQPLLNSNFITEDQEYGDQETHSNLATSFFLPNHPSLEFRGFDTRCIGAAETMISPDAFSNSRLHVVTPTMISSSIQDAVTLPPFLLDLEQTEAVGNALERTPHEEKMKTGTSTVSEVSSNAKKKSYMTGKREKVAPAKAKKIKTKPSKTEPEIAIAPLDTCIRVPKAINKHDPLWNHRLKDAVEFLKEHGHCRIPTTYEPNPELSKWARRQRYHYKNYKKHVLDRPGNPAVASSESNKKGVRMIKCDMTSKRLAKLEEIGFCFDLQSSSWDIMYERLCKYAEENNGETSPSKHFEFDLWKWVGTQRYQMKLRKDREEDEKNSTRKQRNSKTPSLTMNRIAKLNKIQFDWHPVKKISDQQSKDGSSTK